MIFCLHSLFYLQFISPGFCQVFWDYVIQFLSFTLCPSACGKMDVHRGQMLLPMKSGESWAHKYCGALLVEAQTRQSSMGPLGSVSWQNSPASSAYLKQESFVKAWLRPEALPFLMRGLCYPVPTILHLEHCWSIRKGYVALLTPLVNYSALSIISFPLCSALLLHLLSVHQSAVSCPFSLSCTLALALAL